MDVLIWQGKDYTHVAVACVDADGVAIDPSAAEAWFYLLDEGDGSVALDTNIDTDGKVTLAKINSQTGFYGASIDTSSLTAGEYTVLFKCTVDGSATIGVGKLFISLQLSYLDVAVSSVSGGTGAVEYTYTLTEEAPPNDPIPDAYVWFTTDVGGSNQVAAGRTDSSGDVVVNLNTGTIYVWRQKFGYEFDNPETKTVT